MKLLLVSLLLVNAICSGVDADDQTEFYKKFGTFDFGVESGWVTIDSIEPYGGPEDVNKFFYQIAYMKGRTSKTVQPDDNLLLWFNGGPGCSSMLGMYTEQGPFTIKKSADKTKKYDLTMMQFPWNDNAHVLFLDQPFGAGLSWSNASTILNNTAQASQYFGKFLYTFLNDHTSLKTNPLYIFGESYAGHYIPGFAKEIRTNPDLAFVNYKGIGIGDGWTNPLYQVASYAPYLYSIGLVDAQGRSVTQQITNQAQQDMLNEQWEKGSEMFDSASGGPYFEQKVSVSPYNYWVYEQYNPKPPTPIPEDFVTFLNENKEQFKIPSFVSYQECNDTIYTAFKADIAQSRQFDIEYLLTQGKVLLYNGQLDYIVNTPGAQMWINTIQWNSMALWKQQKKQILYTGRDGNKKVAGTYKAYDNLEVYTIYQAGHMVPTDQPEAAFTMLNNFMTSPSR